MLASDLCCAGQHGFPLPLTFVEEHTLLYMPSGRIQKNHEFDDANKKQRRASCGDAETGITKGKFGGAAQRGNSGKSIGYFRSDTCRKLMRAPILLQSSHSINVIPKSFRNVVWKVSGR